MPRLNDGSAKRPLRTTENALQPPDDNMFCNAGKNIFLPGFGHCALLAPNMGGMVLGKEEAQAATNKDSRMKYHGTASACSNAPYKVSRLFCPRCGDLIIAATHSEHVSTSEIHHWWACESCGHEFRTTVRWLRAFADHEPATGETLPKWTLPRALR